MRGYCPHPQMPLMAVTLRSNAWDGGNIWTYYRYVWPYSPRSRNRATERDNWRWQVQSSVITLPPTTSLAVEAFRYFLRSPFLEDEIQRTRREVGIVFMRS